MNELNPYVPNVHFEMIPIRNLVSNQDYQRALSQNHIHRAVENFDPYQINPVKVSRRKGINYVFNGQHTIEIVAMASGSRDTPVWCMIYDDLNYQQEADIFANQQKYVKPLSPYEIFRANLEAGNEEQLLIRDLVHNYGLTLSNKKGPCMIVAVSTVESIYRKYGFQVLNRILRICVDTWEGDMNSFSANILNALAKLCVIYGERLVIAEFAERIGKLSIKQLTRMARERRPGSMGLAEIMVIEYNGKRKNPSQRLPFSWLNMKDSQDYLEAPDEDSDQEPVLRTADMEEM